MAKKNEKPVSILSFDDCDKALLELAKNESFIAKKEAEMNAKTQKIKEQFDQETEEARALQALFKKEVESFCLINKAEFLQTRKKLLLHGSIGFQTNPPKVSQLNKKYNVKTSLELLKKIFTGKYIREKEEINKEEILIAYSAGFLTDEKLAAVGLKIDQDETFTLDINWESLGEKIIDINKVA